jgi:hypothetical protein
MGTHGRNLASAAFFGSTVRGTILSAPVPVITVRSAVSVPREKEFKVTEEEVLEQLTRHGQAQPAAG